MSFKQFFDGYLDCLLWSTCANQTEGSDESFEQAGFTVSDFDPSSLATLKEEAQDFYTANHDLWSADSDLHDSSAGHDFWLTREGHGSGFWDRNLGKLGDQLTDLAKIYGTCHVYVGDDGKIHT